MAARAGPVFTGLSLRRDGPVSALCPICRTVVCAGWELGQPGWSNDEHRPIRSPEAKLPGRDQGDGDPRDARGSFTGRSALGAQQRAETRLYEVPIERERRSDPRLAHDDKRDAVRHAPFFILVTLEEREGPVEQLRAEANDLHVIRGGQQRPAFVLVGN